MKTSIALFILDFQDSEVDCVSLWLLFFNFLFSVVV